MKKNFFLLLALVSVFLFSGSIVYGNELKSGSFEVPWKIVDYYGGGHFPATSLTTESASDGQLSVRIEHIHSPFQTDPACQNCSTNPLRCMKDIPLNWPDYINGSCFYGGDWTTVAQDMRGRKLNPNRLYQLTFSYKTNSTSWFDFRFVPEYLICCHNIAVVVNSRDIIADEQWHTLSYNFMLTQQMYDEIQNGTRPMFGFTYDYGALGTLFIDNVILKEIEVGILN